MHILYALGDSRWEQFCYVRMDLFVQTGLHCWIIEVPLTLQFIFFWADSISVKNSFSKNEKRPIFDTFLAVT